MAWITITALSVSRKMAIQTAKKTDGESGDLIGMLLDCHRRIEGFSRILCVVTDRAQHRTMTYEEKAAANSALQYLREGVRRHIANEEESLFPKLRMESCRGRLEELGALEMDHRIIDNLSQAVLTLYSRWIADGHLSAEDEQKLRSNAGQLKSLCEKHTQTEEQILFPLAASMKGGQPLLSVVVPVYNEAATLPDIIARLLNLREASEIIIVDDCSTDGTSQIVDQLAADQPRIKVAHHEVNAGKTAALATGFALTTGKIVIVQDADLEYDPAEICHVIAPIVEGHADVVFGSRFLVRKASRVLYFRHYLGNQWLTFLSNLCTNINMTDVETCYKAFRGEIIRNMTITSSGFGFEIEVAAKLAKLGVVIYEVPISYYGRTYEQGKKIGMKDFIAALIYIFRFNFLCSLKNSFRVIPVLKRAATAK
jgi:hemerythrin-like domain-containing protein